MNLNDCKQKITEAAEQKSGVFDNIADEIWGFAEARFNLKASADAIISVLEREGFEVERGVAGMSDAFVATWGGGPTVGFLAEYDALAGMSQIAGIYEKRAMQPGENGHGCCHNGLGAGSLAAAVSLKDCLSVKGAPKATVKFYGCPAEESGSGKAFMARGGVFDGADALFSWHPWTEPRVWGTSSLANYQVYYNFKGISSHAAASPEMGRSALDAAELMSVGVNYLREHIIDLARIHYAYINAGGESPNVVQPNSRVLYFIRAPRSCQLRPIFDRVTDVARGAALMTGTSMEVEWDSACSEFIINDALGRAMYENMLALGEIKYSGEEKSYAGKYVETLPETARRGVAEMIKKSFAGVGGAEAERMASEPLLPYIFPYSMTDNAMPGSTDVGDASWIAPTAQLLATCYPAGLPSHSWQWVASGKSSIMHKGILYAGKAMAMTALDAIADPELLANAKREHESRIGGEKYNCAIPMEVTPL